MSAEPMPQVGTAHALICNPTARSGRGRRAWERLTARLEAAGVEYHVRVSEHAGHAAALAEEEARRGTDVLVAVGGDGTINEVASGLMRADRPGRRPALGILYTGTSPDVCRFHGIPIDPGAAVRTLAAGRRRAVDVGEITFRAGSGPGDAEPTRSFFLCSVNLGLGAAVAQGSNDGLRRYCGDGLGTLLSLLRAAVTFRPAGFDCLVDGRPLALRRVYNITVGKNPFIASGLKVAAPIAPDDGRMYLFVLQEMSLLELLGNVPRLYDGTLHRHPRCLYREIRAFACAENPGAPRVEFDGDPRGFLPCTITLRPKALDLIVPDPEAP